MCCSIDFLLSLDFDLESILSVLVDLECLIKKLTANLSITTVKNGFYLLMIVILLGILGVDLGLFEILISKIHSGFVYL